MCTGIHGEQTIIIFGLPCWFSSLRLSGLLSCVQLNTGTSARVTRPLPVPCGGHCDTSMMSLIKGNFPAVHLCWHVVFYAPQPHLWQIAKCTSAACSHSDAPSRFLPARQSVRSSDHPCAANLAEHGRRCLPAHSLAQRLTPNMCELCFVLVQIGYSTHLLQKQTPHHGHYTALKSVFNW